MRIRSIKPEFWRSEDIAALDRETRLLFIGLWSYVDDNGVGRDNERVIVADLFALDDPRDTLASVSRGLQTLSEQGLITRYTVDGKAFLHVCTWEDHQRIDRPNKARYPLPTCENAQVRDTLATPSRHPREDSATGAGEQRSRGTEEGTPLRDKSREKEPTPNRFDEFWDAYDRKVDRKKAEKAYATAIKKPGVTEDLIIAAATQYVTWQRSEGKHPSFTKHPTTWLHGECWNDERAARQPAPIPEMSSNMAAHMALVEQLRQEEAAAQNVIPIERQIGH